MKEVIRFYDQDFLEKGLENMTEEIAAYLRFEEHYFADVLENMRNISGKEPVLIDIGCGNGRILRLADGACGALYGIDNAKKQTHTAHENVPGALIIYGDGTMLPLKDGSADCTTCMYNTLGNIPTYAEQIGALTEMRRVLKEEGIGIVSVYAEGARDAQKRFYSSLGLEIDSETEDAYILKEGLHSRRFSIDMLEELFRAAGLQYNKITEVRINETTTAYICEVKRVQRH